MFCMNYGIEESYNPMKTKESTKNHPEKLSVNPFLDDVRKCA